MSDKAVLMESYETIAELVAAARAYVNQYGSGTSETSHRLYRAVKNLDRAQYPDCVSPLEDDPAFQIHLAVQDDEQPY